MLRPYETHPYTIGSEWHDAAKHLCRARLIPQARLTVDLGAPYAVPPTKKNLTR